MFFWKSTKRPDDPKEKEALRFVGFLECLLEFWHDEDIRQLCSGKEMKIVRLLKRGLMSGNSSAVIDLVHIQHSRRNRVSGRKSFEDYDGSSARRALRHASERSQLIELITTRLASEGTGSVVLRSIVDECKRKSEYSGLERFDWDSYNIPFWRWK